MRRTVLPTATATATAIAGLGIVLGAAVLGPHTAAAADATCTARAALPAAVALTSRQQVLHPRLVGDAGCRPGTFDGGATATLEGPRGTKPYAQRWEHFGATETITLVAGLVRPGIYRMEHGDVQVYDADSVRTPWRWVSTSYTVRYGASVRARRTGTTVSGSAGHYSADGWIASRNATVTLQRRVGAGWRAVASTRTGTSGRWTLRGGDAGERVVVSGTAIVWGATATVG